MGQRPRKYFQSLTGMLLTKSRRVQELAGQASRYRPAKPKRACEPTGEKDSRCLFAKLKAVQTKRVVYIRIICRVICMNLCLKTMDFSKSSTRLISVGGT